MQVRLTKESNIRDNPNGRYTINAEKLGGQDRIGVAKSKASAGLRKRVRYKI